MREGEKGGREKRLEEKRLEETLRREKCVTKGKEI